MSTQPFRHSRFSNTACSKAQPWSFLAHRGSICNTQDAPILKSSSTRRTTASKSPPGDDPSRTTGRGADVADVVVGWWEGSGHMCRASKAFRIQVMVDLVRWGIKSSAPTAGRSANEKHSRRAHVGAWNPFWLVMVGQEQRDACIQQHSGDLVGSRQVSDMRLRLFTILHTPISYVRVPFERGFDCGQQMRFRGHNLFKLFEATNSSGHVFSPIAKTLFTDWIGIGQKNHLPGEPHQKCSTLEPPPIRLEAIE